MPDGHENKIRQMATNKIIDITTRSNWAKDNPNAHSDTEAFFHRSEEFQNHAQNIISFGKLMQENPELARIIKPPELDNDSSKPDHFNDISPWESSSFSAYQAE